MDALIHFDSSGSVICKTLFTEGDEDDFTSIATDKTSQFIYITGDLYDTTVFGFDTLRYTGDMPFLARWQCNNGEGINNINLKTSSLTLYPNPNNGSFTISAEKQSGERVIEIYNMLGEKIYTQTFSTLNSQLLINIGNRPSGIYLYRITGEQGSTIANGRFIIN